MVEIESCIIGNWCEWMVRRNWPPLLTGSPLAPDMTAIKDNNSASTVRHWRRERSGFQRSVEDWVIKCQPAHYTSTASCSHLRSLPTWHGNFDKLIICRKTQSSQGDKHFHQPAMLIVSTLSGEKVTWEVCRSHNRFHSMLPHRPGRTAFYIHNKFCLFFLNLK